MFVSNFILKSGGRFGSGDSKTKWQWQPTLTIHDPNPPIALEDAAVVLSGNVLRMLTGVGV